MDEAATSTLDYAQRPPLRRKVMRRLTWTVLIIAAIASAWVVIPRLAIQAERVRVQRELLENRAVPGTAPVTDATWMGLFLGIGMMQTNARTPGLSTFTQWAGPRGMQVAAYAGGRIVSENERIVVVEVSPLLFSALAPSGVSISATVYEPGGWTAPPRLVSQTVTALPLSGEVDLKWVMRVFPGSIDPQDAAAFDIPLETGYAGQDGMRRFTLRGRLLKNDSLRFELIPADDFPDSFDPDASKLSKIEDDVQRSQTGSASGSGSADGG